MGTLPAGMVPWKPGQSGNPTGRSQAWHDFALLARSHSPEALAKCIELMNCGDHRVELMACIHIMDRGMGKCKEPPNIPDRPMGMPWRIAFALQADGWWLRSDIIWHKPNQMPESITDRPTKSHEYVFFLTKSARYFYDADAVREQTLSLDPKHPSYRPNSADIAVNGRKEYSAKHKMSARSYNESGRNLRSVWTIEFSEAHFATFPPKLAETCIKAGTSEKGCCPECGAPLVRKTERPIPPAGMFTKTKSPDDNFVNRGFSHDGSKRGFGQKYQNWLNNNPPNTIGWSPTCVCPSGAPIPCTVLDPFAGAGTALMVADRLQRNAIGIELNPAYAAMADKRLADDRGPLLAAMAAE